MVGKLRQLFVREATLGAENVEGPVGDDAVQPRPERTPVVEAPERGERPLEAVGCDVVRERAPPGDRVGGTPCVAPVAAKERSRSLAVAASGLSNEFPVTRFTHSSGVLYVQPPFARPEPGILRP